MKRLLVLLALVTLASSPPAQAGGGAGIVRRPAPNFVFTDIGGERVNLSHLRGQVVIVLFGDLGCAPCRQNDQLLRPYQLEDLTNDLVVSLHERVNSEALRRYDAAFTFSTLTGPDPGQEIARRYGALPIPTTVLIDRDGFIREVRRGRLDEGQLVRALGGLL
ncbi:TlpA family protein disulfide reductase [Deinococcus planocerae]|uniref:TlpA family protein disulfide reductase n=1 Tax=Deinococcus planocerae TaxID=1737569 RepID=UPI000C7E86BA|nr:TlpA disulfide reductase family protein [Deinococcus planocerae]